MSGASGVGWAGSATDQIRNGVDPLSVTVATKGLVRSNATRWYWPVVKLSMLEPDGCRVGAGTASWPNASGLDGSSRFQSRTVPSPPAVASTAPVGAKSRESTHVGWALRSGRAIGSPIGGTDHSFTVPVEVAAASVRSSGLTARAYTWCPAHEGSSRSRL